MLVVDGGFNCDGGLGHDACSNIEYMHVSVVQGNYGTKVISVIKGDTERRKGGGGGERI